MKKGLAIPIIFALLLLSCEELLKLEEKYGNVEGKVQDAETLDAIRGVIVKIDAQETMTDYGGEYEFLEVPTGERTIIFRVGSYLDYSTKIEIVENEWPYYQICDAKLTPKTFSIGETADNNLAEVTFYGFTTADSISYDLFGYTHYDVPDSGKHFIIVDVKVKNIGGESFYVWGDDFRVKDAEDIVYEYDSWATSHLPDEFEGGDLSGAEAKRGKLAFETPKGASNLELIETPFWGQSHRG